MDQWTNKSKRFPKKCIQIEKGGTARHLFESYFFIRNWDTIGPVLWSMVFGVFLDWRVRTFLPLRPLKMISESGFLKQMKEAVFNTEIVNSIKTHWFVHKLSDSIAVPGVTRFIGEKPCDTIAFIYGRGVGIEGKMLKKWKGISIKLFRENQIEALDEMLMAHGRAFAFINVRIAANAVTGTKHENRLIIIDWEKWLKRRNKTIPVKVVRKAPHIKGKKGKFDLSEFFLNIKNAK